MSSRLGVDGHIDTIDRFVNRLGRLFVIFGIAWFVVIKERITVKASRDNGNNQLILQLGLERRTKDNVGIGRYRTSDNLSCFLNLGHTHIVATRHIKEYTLGTVDRHLNQWRINCLLGCHLSSVFATSPADPHQCTTSTAHNCLDISKV